jgi:hypothetical protein
LVIKSFSLLKTLIYIIMFLIFCLRVCVCVCDVSRVAGEFADELDTGAEEDSNNGEGKSGDGASGRGGQGRGGGGGNSKAEPEPLVDEARAQRE